MAKKAFRIYAKAAPNYSLGIRDGMVVLVRADSSDDSQQWFKDETFSSRVKDNNGLPGIALVNKATGLAIRHATGATRPVQLVPYNAKYLDETVLWTEGYDLSGGFRAIRMVNNTSLNLDAFGADANGHPCEGTVIGLWEWLQGDNQMWKIVPC